MRQWNNDTNYACRRLKFSKPKVERNQRRQRTKFSNIVLAYHLYLSNKEIEEFLGFKLKHPLITFK